MTKKIVLLAAACLLSLPVRAQTAPPTNALCPALREEVSYAKDFEDFAFILPGKDGYLFRTKQDFYLDYDLDKRDVAAWRNLSDMLRARGTTLVLAYIPTRGMIARQYLPPATDPLMKGFEPAQAIARYGALIEGLNKANIAAVGVLTPSPEFFYKADHHWTSAGASAMARALADKIKTLPGYAEIPKLTYKTSPGKKVLFKGSTNKALLSICGHEAADDTDILTVTTRADAGDEKDALFADESPAQIVLVGTSNSKKENNNLNFDGFLKEYLSADVYNAAISGGGIDDSIQSYLASDLYRRNPPKFLIWEIPGYYNLAGSKTQALLREVIPAAIGDCTGANVLADANIVPEDKVTPLFGNLTPRNIVANQSYLSLRFAKAENKHFSVEFRTGEEGGETFKFKRSKSYPKDGVFFYAPRGDKVLSGVNLVIPDKLRGIAVDARLCRRPGNDSRKKDAGKAVKTDAAPKGALDKLRSIFKR